jgi:hypothetical protein
MTNGHRSILPAIAHGAALCACAGGGGGAGEPDPAEGSVFLAFAEDFRGYHSYQSFDVTGEASLIGIHDGSTVIEYINKLPLSGSTEFPLGTIIVKEASGGTNTHELFAMVKRGGGFNSGAPGWEWFELENLDDGADGVKVVWRGFGPPVGEMYGGDAAGGCNKCHGACNDNDSVCSSSTRLSNF